MAQYATLKAAIEDVIKPNGNKEITGQLLQNALIAMIESLGVDCQFAGVATPETNPGTPDQNVMYIAGAGTYPNFGPTRVKLGEIGVFTYKGSWQYVTFPTDTTNNVVNINQIANHPSYYTTLQDAFADVPERYRKPGCITSFYLLDEEGVPMRVGMMYIGDDIEDWEDADYWLNMGPVYLRESYDSDNYWVLQIGLDSNFKIIDTLQSFAKSHVLSANQGRVLNEKIEGYEIEVASIGTTSEILPRPILQGSIITKIDGTNKLIFGSNEVVTTADLPYKMQNVANTVKTESGTVTNVTIGVRGVIGVDFINVNDYYGHSAAFGSALLARTEVAATERKKGLKITYLLASGWIEEQFIGSDIADWTVADNWKVTGPVTVSQNTQTGHTDINIGNNVYPVASVGDLKKCIDGEFNLSLLDTSQWFLTARLNREFKQGEKIKFKVAGTAIFADNTLSVRYDDETTGLTSLSNDEENIVTIGRDTNYLYFIINKSNITTEGTINVLCQYGEYLQLITNEKDVNNKVDLFLEKEGDKKNIILDSYPTQLRGTLNGSFKSGTIIRFTAKGTAEFADGTLVVRYGDGTTALTTLSKNEQKKVTLAYDTDGILFLINKYNITTEGSVTIDCEWGLYLDNVEGHEKLERDIENVDAKIDTLAAKESADIDGIYQLYGSYDLKTKNKGIRLYFDDTPNANTYKLTLNCTRTDITSCDIYKCTTTHSGLTFVARVNFGETVLIERDADKPSLYLYSDTYTGNFDDDITYNLVFTKNKETIEGDLRGVEELVKWKGKNIVIFGDSITEFSYNGKRYSDYIVELTGANVINVGIGGTRLCPRAALITIFDSTKQYVIGNKVYYDDGNSIDCYQFTSNHIGEWDASDVEVATYSIFTGYPNVDIYNMIAACCDTETPIEHRFDNQIVAMDYLYEKHPIDDNRAIVAQLPNIDWSTIDVVIIMGGTNDWGNTPIGNDGDSTPTTLIGSINAIIQTLLSTYNIKLYWFTYPVSWNDYAGPSPLPPSSDFSDYYIKGGKTGKEFAAIIKDTVIANHIPIGDLYNEIGWNMANFSDYFLDNDGTHPRKGFDIIARYMVSKIKSVQTF